MGEAEAGVAVVSGTRLTDRIGAGVLTRLFDRDLVDDAVASAANVALKRAEIAEREAADRAEDR